MESLEDVQGQQAVALVQHAIIANIVMQVVHVVCALVEVEQRQEHTHLVHTHREQTPIILDQPQEVHKQLLLQEFLICQMTFIQDII